MTFLSSCLGGFWLVNWHIFIFYEIIIASFKRSDTWSHAIWFWRDMYCQKPLGSAGHQSLLIGFFLSVAWTALDLNYSSPSSTSNPSSSSSPQSTRWFLMVLIEVPYLWWSNWSQVFAQGQIEHHNPVGHCHAQCYISPIVQYLHNFVSLESIWQQMHSFLHSTWETCLYLHQRFMALNIIHTSIKLNVGPAIWTGESDWLYVWRAVFELYICLGGYPHVWWIVLSYSLGIVSVFMHAYKMPSHDSMRQ